MRKCEEIYFKRVIMHENKKRQTKQKFIKAYKAIATESNVVVFRFLKTI